MTRYKLRKATEHIYYEAWMFYQTLSLLKVSRNPIGRNILLDAFAIHTRNLFDFFYPKKTNRHDDMSVNDYVSDSSYFKSNRTPKRDLLFIVRKADKQVAHLTYIRNRYNKKSKNWPFLRIGQRMHKNLEAFYFSIPNSYRKWEYFIKFKEQINLNVDLQDKKSG